MAAPDPWKIKRLRRSVVGFAVFVAAIHLVFLRFQVEAWKHSSNPPEPRADGTYLWAIMSWFFLACLIFELRRQKPNPFPGSSRRSATLTPRHNRLAVPRYSWWMLGALWFTGSAILLTVLSEYSITTWSLIGATGLLLFLGPICVRNSALGPEPLPEQGNAELSTLYAKQRTVRSWAVFVILALSLLSQLGSALMIGLAGLEPYLFAMFYLVVGCLAIIVVLYLGFEVSYQRRISALTR